MKRIHEKDLLEVSDTLYPHGRLINAKRLEGGFSCDVFILDIQTAHKESKLVFRSEGSYPADNSIETEFNLLKVLNKTNLPVSEAIYLDTSCKILHKPFMIMSYLDGSLGTSNEKVICDHELMATQLRNIHQIEIDKLSELSLRVDPLDQLLSYIPKGRDWNEIRNFIKNLSIDEYKGKKCLLHGDYWPGNILWNNENISGILDWEYAAIGDPLADLAVTCLDARYSSGEIGMNSFKQKYLGNEKIDEYRFNLWLIYIAASTLHYINNWNLDKQTKSIMKRESKLTILGSFNIIKNQS